MKNSDKKKIPVDTPSAKKDKKNCKKNIDSYLYLAMKKSRYALSFVNCDIQIYINK